ncbi:hypothetical protein [Microbacterium sp. SORGH_AS_0888]|uniref:hypothetical protein n=1 Tax=Microbacterium sp. SORGH_AS_0888 TaxID=3041791 RepID=UPI00278672FD|nr:hypothetical protein [Microbacterium sp. SORGH_AS_0888]MDQ1130929.1 putative acyltransferase (DUF342 family) [Microbacterium sp. SORGH_AS_0888]
MLDRFLNDRRNPSRDEEGAALLSVVILMVVMFVICASLQMTLVNAVQLTAMHRSSVTTLAAAESGTAVAVFSLTKGECKDTAVTGDGFVYEVHRSASATIPSGLNDPSVSAGCPRDGDRYALIKSTGTDTYGKSMTVTQTYLWVNKVKGSNDGALTSGSGNVELSSLTIAEEDAGLVLLDGDFNCNTNTRIKGDVVVLSGSVRISNACVIDGSLFASENVAIQNPAVAVTGDVFTLGNFSTASGSVIGGSVYAQGDLVLSSGTRVQGGVVGAGTGLTNVDNVNIGLSLRTNGPLRVQNKTVIGGDVATTNTATADFFDSTIHGNVHIAGTFQQLGATTIGGSVTVSGAGANNIAPSTSIDKNLTVAGTIATWDSGPRVTGTKATNTATAAPNPVFFLLPDELKPETYSWRDYTYDDLEWAANGYDRVGKTACDLQNSPALVREVNERETPTVYDLRGCSTVNMNAVTFSLKTDVAFIANAFTNAQQVRVKSADGEPHEFSLLTPDSVVDRTPSCSNGQGESNIYGLTMSEKITGYIYTPCVLTFGGGSIINGQLYSGAARYQGGQPMTLNYAKTGVPGFPLGEGEDPREYGFQTDVDARALPKLVKHEEG